MKKVLLSAVAILTFSFANAQEEATTSTGGFAKGDMFLSGSVGFGSEKMDETSVNQFTVAPKAGYFITENIAVGVGLSFGNGNVKDDGDKVAENKSLSAGVFGRYYVKTSGFAPFVELGVNYGTTNTEFSGTIVDGSLAPAGSGEDFNTFGVQVAPGFNYFVSDKFALETSVGILGYSSSKEDVSGAESVNSFQFGLDFARINFGIIYKF